MIPACASIAPCDDGIIEERHGFTPEHDGVAQGCGKIAPEDDRTTPEERKATRQCGGRAADRDETTQMQD